jgi:hypothetical protein
VVVLDVLIHGTNRTVQLDPVDAIPPYLRVLSTSHAPRLHLGLEVPNTIDGIGAAIFSFCEMHGIIAHVLCSLMEAECGKDCITNSVLLAYLDAPSVFPMINVTDKNKWKAKFEKELKRTGSHRLASSNNPLYV